MAGSCDKAETCTGSAATCPSDSYLPSAYICRATAGVCDKAETCTGSAATCPSNLTLPNGYPCLGSWGVGTCQGGKCLAKPDAGVPDAGLDGGQDGAMDAGLDGAVDMGPDQGADMDADSGTNLDAGPGADLDAATAVDAGQDTGGEAGLDAGTEGGVDATTMPDRRPVPDTLALDGPPADGGSSEDGCSVGHNSSRDRSPGMPVLFILSLAAGLAWRRRR